MAFVTFPEPADLQVPYENMITDGKPLNFQKWTLDNPHPGFGKDPNILNEYGHTKFPMWIASKIELNPNGTSKQVLVHNDQELDAHTKPDIKQFTVTDKPSVPAALAWPK